MKKFKEVQKKARAIAKSVVKSFDGEFPFYASKETREMMQDMIRNHLNRG